MTAFRILFALDARLIRNRYFRTARQAAASITIFLLILGVLAGLTLALRHLLGRAVPEVGAAAMVGLPVGMLFAVSLMLFMTSVQGLVQNFYRSPDLTFLMATPIPGDALVAFKLLSHLRSTLAGTSMAAVPLLVATGLILNAHFSYYLVLGPLYLLVAVVSSHLGVVLGLLGMSVLPPRVFTALSTGLPVVLGIAGWALYVVAHRASHLLAPLGSFLGRLFEMPAIIDLIPPLAAGRVAVMAAAGHLGEAGQSAGLLVAVTLAVAAFSLPVTRRLFRRGWLRALPVATQPSRARPRPRRGFRSRRLGPALSVALLDLRFAARNREMWSATLGSLALYLGPVFVLAVGGYLPGREAGVMSLLVTGASLLSVIAASVPFYTMELMADRNLITARFWLLKILPVRDLDVFTGRFLAHMAVAVPAGVLGLTVFALARPVTAPLFAASVAATALFTAAMMALHLGWEALVIHRFGGVLSPVANVLSMGLDAALIILGPGLLAAYAWRDVVARVPIVGGVPDALGLFGTLAISCAVGLSFLWLWLRIGIDSWRRMEI